MRIFGPDADRLSHPVALSCSSPSRIMCACIKYILPVGAGTFRLMPPASGGGYLSEGADDERLERTGSSVSAEGDTRRATVGPLIKVTRKKKVHLVCQTLCFAAAAAAVAVIVEENPGCALSLFGIFVPWWFRLVLMQI